MLFSAMCNVVALMREIAWAERTARDSSKPSTTSKQTRRKHGNADVDDAGL